MSLFKKMLILSYFLHEKATQFSVSLRKEQVFMKIMTLIELLQFIQENEDKVIIVEVEYGTGENQIDQGQ